VAEINWRTRSSRMIRASRERSSEQPVEQRVFAHHFVPFFQFALVLPIALTRHADGPNDHGQDFTS